MWFFSFIPDNWLHWFVHSIVLIGIILSILGAVAKNIPTIAPYGFVAKAVGGLVFIIGIFFEGGYGVEMSWRTKTAELQSKVELAQKQSAEANINLNKKLIDNRSVIKDSVNANYKAIEDSRNSINAECRVNDIAWMLYNRAVESKVSRGTVTIDGTGTGTKASTGR